MEFITCECSNETFKVGQNKYGETLFVCPVCQCRYAQLGGEIVNITIKDWVEIE